MASTGFGTAKLKCRIGLKMTRTSCLRANIVRNYVFISWFISQEQKISQQQGSTAVMTEFFPPTPAREFAARFTNQRHQFRTSILSSDNRGIADSGIEPKEKMLGCLKTSVLALREFLKQT